MKAKGSQVSSELYNAVLDTPRADEVEISLFGPSYGECVVIHAGDGIWFVVDSCAVPGTRKPRALDYFESIQVDPTVAIKRIIATHWDDDHIRGLSQLVELATGSEFVMSAAVFSEEFLTLVKLYENWDFGTGPGVKEFARILAVLIARNKLPRLALEETTIWNSFKNDREDGSLVSLSPSNATVMDGHLNIAQLLRQLQRKTLRVPEANRNDRSVVLWLRVGKAVALLGSDLLENGDSQRGWSAILLSNIQRARSQVFKVPHHGSITAHDDRVWSELVVPGCPCVIAPWRKGTKALPSREDIERIREKSDQVYVTAIPQNLKKSRPPQVQRLIDSTTRKIRLVDEYAGHIRLRADSGSCTWRVALFNGARKVEGRMSKAFPQRK